MPSGPAMSITSMFLKPTRLPKLNPMLGRPHSRVNRFAHDDGFRVWHKPAVRGWEEHVRSARVFQTSTCSAKGQFRCASQSHTLVSLSASPFQSGSSSARRNVRFARNIRKKNDLGQGLGLVAEVVCQRAGWLEPTHAVT